MNSLSYRPGPSGPTPLPYAPDTLTRLGRFGLDVYLIDGTYELFRHYYALPPARDAKGREVAAVRGVLRSVLGMINDGATHETILYVEGAPVLRNVADAPGLATLAANMPWIIGAGSWDGARADGFFGSIGEIRIVNQALKPAQWLTARRGG